MAWFKSKFRVPDGGPSFYDFWANSINEADRIARLFNFDEPHRTSKPPYEYRVSRNAEHLGWAHPDVLHNLCFLSYLAGRADRATVTDVVGDGSPIHELAHYLICGPNIRDGQQLKLLNERVRWLESRVPGMPPDDVTLQFKIGAEDKKETGR